MQLEKQKEVEVVYNKKVKLLRNKLEFFKKHEDIIFIVLLLLSLPLFFYNLGQSSLTNWDEAWYADIARNILKTGNIFTLYWNGEIFSDHPPAGFWVTAIIFKILGISEFTARLPQALFGMLSLVTIYLLGKELFNKWVGLASAIALSSSIWFLYRARSGNLDITLTFFYLLTLFLALKVVRDKKYLVPLAISFTILMLTKTLVPLTIFPSLFIIFWKQKINFKDLRWLLVIFLGLFGTWLVTQIITQPGFISHFFKIGLPGIKVETNYSENLQLIKEYLHSGIGKWFWPGLFGVFIGLLLRQKRFLILSVFFVTFFVPFIFSAKGHIWHLIPLHPIMVLSFFGVAWVILEKFLKKSWLVAGLILITSVYISFNQIKMSWYQFIDIPGFISDEAILSIEAGKYPQKFYIDGDFGPTAIFYSNKQVSQVSPKMLPPMFFGNDSFLMITKQSALDSAKIPVDRYKIIKSDRDKILVRKI